jgi:hypothetical protein
MSPVGLKTKNYCAGEGQQQLAASQSVSERKSSGVWRGGEDQLASECPLDSPPQKGSDQ